MFFLFFCIPIYGFICDFLEFPSVKSSKIFTAHCILRDTNFKHNKVGSVKAVEICLYSLYRKKVIAAFSDHCDM